MDIVISGRSAPIAEQPPLSIYVTLARDYGGIELATRKELGIFGETPYTIVPTASVEAMLLGVRGRSLPGAKLERLPRRGVTCPGEVGFVSFDRKYGT